MAMEGKLVIKLQVLKVAEPPSTCIFLSHNLPDGDPQLSIRKVIPVKSCVVLLVIHTPEVLI